jgi:hypothetical protein
VPRSSETRFVTTSLVGDCAKPTRDVADVDSFNRFIDVANIARRLDVLNLPSALTLSLTRFSALLLARCCLRVLLATLGALLATTTRSRVRPRKAPRRANRHHRYNRSR